MKKRKGFTLIELVISMAILLIIFAITFGVISRYYTVRTFYEQQTELQKNLVFATDRLADDFKQAKYLGTSVFVNPTNNAMIDATEDNPLSFYSTNGDIISYYLKQNINGTYAIYRKVNAVAQPITEDMHQLVKLYFIRYGGSIVATVVGQISYFGKTDKISFTLLVYSRNSQQVELPP